MLLSMQSRPPMAAGPASGGPDENVVYLSGYPIESVKLRRMTKKNGLGEDRPATQKENAQFSDPCAEKGSSPRATSYESTNRFGISAPAT